MAQDPKGASEGRMVHMSPELWKGLLELRHTIENDRGRTIPSGEEVRIFVAACLPHILHCKACRSGEVCPDGIGRVDPTTSSPESKQAEIRPSRARKGKASG